MNALWFDGKRLSLRENKIPRPEKNEALIQVLYAGICNTDLEILQGYLNFTGIPGHEFIGRVIVGPGQWPGKRVTGEINLGCGKCASCKAGLSRHCPNRTVLGISNRNGAFAEYLTLPVENLHPVPKSISDLDAVFIEPLAASLRILDQVKIRKNQSVFLLGDGKLSQLIARALRLETKKLLVIGKHPEKLQHLSRLGIKTALAKDLMKIDPLKKPDLVIEATGRPSGLQMALKLCRPAGTIVLKSTFQQSANLDLSQLVVDEIDLIGSRCGEFGKAIRYLQRGKIAPADLVCGIYQLEDFQEAFKRASSKNSLKVILQCQS